MNTLIYRSINEPIRESLTWDEKWKGFDKGLIICWEVGRKKRATSFELVERVKNGELPILEWKGGIEKIIKKKEKYGTLNYLAQWQGLKGIDLNIDTSKETKLKSIRTGMTIIYTSDSSKYSEP